MTAVLTLILANTLNLESISTAGSVGFLLIFAIVNLVGYRLANKINGNKVIPLVGFILCTLALLALLIQQYSTNLLGVIIALCIVVFCFLIEWLYKTFEDTDTLRESQGKQIKS